VEELLQIKAKGIKDGKGNAKQKAS